MNRCASLIVLAALLLCSCVRYPRQIGDATETRYISKYRNSYDSEKRLVQSIEKFGELKMEKFNLRTIGGF